MEYKLAADRTLRESQLNRRFAWRIVGIPCTLSLGCLVLLIARVGPPPLVIGGLSFSLGLLTVAFAAHRADFLQAFRLQTAAFVVVMEPALADECSWDDRKILLARQQGEPHKGMFIYPGGLCHRPGREQLLETAKRKAWDMVGTQVHVATQPILTYKRRLPSPDIAYVGVLYEGFLTRTGQPDVSRTRWMGADELLSSSEVPPLVKQLALELQRKYSFP
jgi:ADP-ribose pyrophosphatase YjhB (NUDIX family)